MYNTFFLDIDDCLIETSRLGQDELNALKNSLTAQKIPKPEEITAEFEKSFHRLYDTHQGKRLSKKANQLLSAYKDRLQELQTDIIREYGQVKKWSREAFLYISAENCGIKLSGLQIETAAVKLWKSITNHNPFYPDSQEFLETLIRKEIPFYLISASDCRLIFNDKNGVFAYDPERSRKLKIKRLKKFIDIGVPEENIFIGDPLDKPNPWIFKEALKKSEKDIGRKSSSVMIGDSINNDLVPAKIAGIDDQILINRHGKKVYLEKNPEIKVITSFKELLALPKL